MKTKPLFGFSGEAELLSVLFCPRRAMNAYITAMDCP